MISKTNPSVFTEIARRLTSFRFFVSPYSIANLMYRCKCFIFSAYSTLSCLAHHYCTSSILLLWGQM